MNEPFLIAFGKLVPIAQSEQSQGWLWPRRRSVGMRAQTT